jgi:hypothetical protein
MRRKNQEIADSPDWLEKSASEGVEQRPPERKRKLLKRSILEIRQNIHLLINKVFHEFPRMTENAVDYVWTTCGKLSVSCSRSSSSGELAH